MIFAGLEIVEWNGETPLITPGKTFTSAEDFRRAMIRACVIDASPGAGLVLVRDPITKIVVQMQGFNCCDMDAMPATATECIELIQSLLMQIDSPVAGTNFDPMEMP